MSAPLAGPGDNILLFGRLPNYLVLEELPLAAGPGVYLDKIPRSVLDGASPPEFADYVLPGYHVDRALWSDYCLRSPQAEYREAEVEPGVLLFNCVAALRLRAPMEIRIEGWFELGKNNEVKNPRLLHLKSAWQPDWVGGYSAHDVALAADIARRQLELWRRKYQRIVTGTMLFLQVTCGFSRSFQMSYLGLFSALEALFVPPQKKKDVTLADRAARFLALPKRVGDWLRGEYGSGRNRLAHGDDDAVPWTNLRDERAQAIGGLHEVTRLSILGFMSLENEKLEELSERSAKRVQSKLDALAPAVGRFMEGQQMWKDRLIRDVEEWLGEREGGEGGDAGWCS